LTTRRQDVVSPLPHVESCERQIYADVPLQIIRRSGPEEKVLVLTRRRRGHRCQHAVMVVGICVWDGIDERYATELYDYLCHLLPDNAEPTERRCGWNERSEPCCQ